MKIKIPFLLLVIVGAISFGVFIPDNAYSSDPDYSEQLSSFYKNNMWQLGKGLEVGQSYTYRICDPEAVVPASAQNYHYFVKGNDDHNQSLCYVAKLNFVNLLSSDEYANDKIWVVQAEIRNLIPGNATTKHTIFHIDSLLFSVKSVDSAIYPDNIRYGKSIENTLFSIRKYALQEEKPLVIGKQWGEITEALGDIKTNPKMTVLDKIENGSSVIQYQLDDNQSVQLQRNFTETYEVGYEVGIIGDNDAIFSKYLIASDIPFPLNATVYSPVYVNEPTKKFEFELLSYIGNDIIDATDEINDNSAVDDTEIVYNDIIEDNNTDNIIEVHEDIETSSPVINDSIAVDDSIADNSVNTEIVDDNKADSSSLDSQNITIIGLMLFGVGGMIFFRRFLKKKRSYDNTNDTKSNGVKTIHFNDEVVIRIRKVNEDSTEKNLDRP